MNIGIYNRWLSTLGGGERYTLAMAKHLSRQHQVTVINHTPVAPDAISRRFGLELGNTRFEIVPERPPDQLQTLATRFDLFVNASNLDFVPPNAPLNAMLIYFPIAAPEQGWTRQRNQMGRYIRRWARLPDYPVGVYGEEWIDGKPMRGLAREAILAFPTSRWGYDVTFELCAANAQPAQVRLWVKGEEIGLVELSKDTRSVPCRLRIPAGRLGESYPLRLTVEQDTRSSHDTLTTPIRAYISPPTPEHTRYRVYHELFGKRLRSWEQRLLNPFPLNMRAIVSGYDELFAISQYTQRWIQNYWQRESLLIYPPVDVERFTPMPKRQQILSVGRFFEGGHNKKHQVLIQAFRRMIDAGLEGWELHLAGGVNLGANHRAYLERLRDKAAGYPIHFHTDVPLAAIIKLFGESTIYWHASGFGEDEHGSPEKFEHFGITTVEAMAAGCVPVVIGRGGQVELIDHSRDGYLWYTERELVEYTQQVIESPTKLEEMAQRAIQKSRRFDQQSFQSRLDHVLASMIETGYYDRC